MVFFFPYHHIGGAENIHLQILQSVEEYKTYTLFTKRSKSNLRLKDFERMSICNTVFEFVRHNGYIKTLFIKKLARILNRSHILNTVFGCNTEFYYELLPYLNSEIKKIDLTHAFSKPDYGVEQFSLSYIQYLDQRVVINNKTKADFISEYDTYAIDKSEANKLICIPNGIAIQETVTSRANSKDLTIGFFGRWSKEKRPELFLDIAKQLSQKDKSITFEMAGTALENHKQTIQKSHVICLGELSKTEDISNFYKNIDVLVVTSYREGFPLVIMEAMSYGVIVISTDVGSIEEHIKSNDNGFLISESDPEQIIRSISEKIVVLSQDSELRKTLHANALAYARANFRIEEFNKAYQKLLIHE